MSLLSNVYTGYYIKMMSCQWLLHRRPIVDSEGTVNFTKCIIILPLSYM